MGRVQPKEDEVSHVGDGQGARRGRGAAGAVPLNACDMRACVARTGELAERHTLVRTPAT